MLQTIGKRPRNTEDLVDLLVDCHDRIRHFIALARKVAAATDSPGHEIIETCAAIEHYFTRALPLHVADEEQSVLPRLRGLASELDAALATMRVQHGEHEAELAGMLEAIELLRESPNDARSRAALASSAERLDQAFGEHLELEETQIFPSIREQLSAEAQDEIIAELRARRQSSRD